ncbi:hypothetical protein C8R43DRAFT_947329 [Mycena crocata]|nr:hypothetical protein C8R43DRAFT_947329 [Mycena crocata]
MPIRLFQLLSSFGKNHPLFVEDVESEGTSNVPALTSTPPDRVNEPVPSTLVRDEAAVEDPENILRHTDIPDGAGQAHPTVCPVCRNLFSIDRLRDILHHMGRQSSVPTDGIGSVPGSTQTETGGYDPSHAPEAGRPSSEEHWPRNVHISGELLTFFHHGPVFAKLKPTGGVGGAGGMANVTGGHGGTGGGPAINIIRNLTLVLRG